MSELVIRRDMIEKKLSLTIQEKALSEERWNRRLEDSQALLARKDKESAEMIDQLQRDVDALENEKQQLKARLLAVSKIQALEGLNFEQNEFFFFTFCGTSEPPIHLFSCALHFWFD
jgi:dynactin 1